MSTAGACIYRWIDLCDAEPASAHQSTETSEYDTQFLAYVNSRLLYAIVRPSVVCLSFVCLSPVTFVRPTQAIQIFGNISTALGTLAIHWHPLKILQGSSQGNPSTGGVKHEV